MRQTHLADTHKASRKGAGHSLALLLPEGLLESITKMFMGKIIDEGLASKPVRVEKG
jgi:hypothetical protein